MIEFARSDYGQEEIDAVNRVLRSQWLASGNENKLFEQEFATYVGRKFAVACNSGSSANLLALAGLNLPRGSKVITSACGFPATLSPILHCSLNPVLVDYSLVSHNIDIEQVINLIRHENNISAVIFAHTMGNPVQVDKLVEVAREYGVKVIEDCCEAVGSKYKERFVGTFGDVGTYSFYPAHQITALGEGGMVVTDDETIYRRMKSLRDWGKMYDWDSGTGGNLTDYNSPIGYHRGYTYETVGWNFKLNEASCAFGREQLKKLDRFRAIRRENYEYLETVLFGLKDFMTPTPLEGADPCWFGFILTIKDGSPLQRNDLGLHLEKNGIRHRPFFAGNILRHRPFFVALEGCENLRFPVADKLMRDTLFIGCHTKIYEENIDFIAKEIKSYVNGRHS
jgi:CDP-6-deoxy-D-xylo-4-hexulose-3-dehydrase